MDGYGATAAYGATASRLRDISAGAGGSIVEIRDHAPGHPARTGFTLRVPSERFAETMGQVEALGGARRERITERDAAADLAALRSRLRDLERREQELSVSAARSRGAAEGRSAEDELARARGRIAEVRAQMSSLSQQIAMPVITVFLVERTMDRRHR